MWNPIKAWREWSQDQYDIWGGKLQEKYDFWDDYDDPALRTRCMTLWKLMPEKLKKSIYKMLTEVLKKYGPDFAKSIIKKLSDTFIDLGVT